MWPRPRPTCLPRFILIRPTVWPQCTNATDRTGQTDRQTDRQTGQRSSSIRRIVFGRPFVKRFALCYQTVVCPVCPSCLSVTFVHCGQTVGRIKMKLGMKVGLGPGHIVLYGDPAPPPQRGTAPQFSVHICCGQMAAWIKMSLGMELGLGPGDFVLDGDPAAPSQKAFGPCLLWPNGWMHQDAT